MTTDSTAVEPQYRFPVDRRRLVSATLLGVGGVLGSNFLGVTSALLSATVPSQARAIKLDRLYPLQQMLRCYDEGGNFEFVYPQEWLADRTVLYRNTQRQQERTFARLDPGPLDGAKTPTLYFPQLKTATVIAEPLVAYGPPGSTGETNVSVIVSPLAEGFDLDSFGTPEQMGQGLLDLVCQATI
eukprot:scaffold1890_cov380-Prasinococcus_capsulatus_cf.AAC.2